VLSLGRNGQLAIPLGKWDSMKRLAEGFFIKPEGNHLLNMEITNGLGTREHWYGEELYNTIAI